MKNFVKSMIIIASIGLLCSCNDAQNSDGSPKKFRTNHNVEKALLLKVDYMPTVCMNGVWYYSAEFVHNTYFAPVFTRKGTVALCDGTKDQYIPEPPETDMKTIK